MKFHLKAKYHIHFNWHVVKWSDKDGPPYWWAIDVSAESWRMTTSFPLDRGEDYFSHKMVNRPLKFISLKSCILLQNTRLMAVLRNLFALLVSVDVVYCQHARKSYLTSTETKEEKIREGSTWEDSFQPVSTFTALILQLLST